MLSSPLSLVVESPLEIACSDLRTCLKELQTILYQFCFNFMYEMINKK